MLTLSTGLVSAQVVTPELDAAFPVEMASAAGWRFGSAIGAQSSFAKITGETEKVDYHNIDSSFLLAYQPSNIIAEIYYATPGTRYDWDYTTDTFQKTSNVDGRFTLALRGEKNVTIGIGYRVSDQDATSDTIQKSMYEGSFSLRMLDNLYLAGGMQRVTEKFETGDSRKWNRILGGAALLFGDPLEQAFRLEASYRSSPESKINGSDIKPHRKTSQLQGGVELLFDGFLLSYKYQNITRGAVGEETEDQSDIRHRYGLGMKLGGFTIGLYAGRGTQTADDKEVSTDFYQGTLSFGFI